MLFDLTIIGFGVIGVETLHSLKKNLLKKKNKKEIKIAVIEKKIDNIPGGIAYSQVNSKFGFFNNPLRLSHPEFIKWFNLNNNKSRILKFAEENLDYNLNEWSKKNKYILKKRFNDYDEIYLPRLIYSFFLKDKIIDFLRIKNKLNIKLEFYKGEAINIKQKKFYDIAPHQFFRKFLLKFNTDNKLIKKETNKKLKIIKSKKIVIGNGIVPPKKIKEIKVENNSNYIWDFYATGGTQNLLKKIYKINKEKKKIKMVFIGNKAGLLETMLEIENLIKLKGINIQMISISKNSLTLKKAERSFKFKNFKFKFFKSFNYDKSITAKQILNLLVKEFKNAKKNGFNKYDVWTNVLKNKILNDLYRRLNSKQKKIYNLSIFPVIRNMTRFTFPNTVSAKNRLEKANHIKTLNDKVISIFKHKNYLLINTSKNKKIKSDIVINVSGPVNLFDLKDEIKIVSSIKRLTKKYNDRGFTTNKNFMLEDGLYLPGTLSNNFNPARETIIKAITKNSHKVAKNIF